MNTLTVSIQVEARKSSPSDQINCSVGFFGFEFPRYNYDFVGKKYRYLYGTGFAEVLPDRLVKIDTDTKVN